MQGTADWHWGRKFSLTSSQGHKSFEAAFAHFQDREHWKTVAEHLWGQNWKSISGLGVRTDSTELMQDTEEDDQADSFTNYFEGLNDGNSVDEIENAAIRSIVSILSGCTSAGTEIAEDQMAAYHKAFVKVVFDRIPEEQRDRVPKSPALASAFFAKFLNASNNYQRSYYGFSKQALEAMIAEKGIRPKKKTIDGMVEALAEFQQKHDSSSKDIDNMIEEDQIRKITMKNIFEKSFQGRLKGEARDHCTLGHKLELPILQSFHNECVKANDSVGNQHFYSSTHALNHVNILSGYTCGLVAKSGYNYAKDSVDFLLTVTKGPDDFEPEVWAMEVKSRLVNRSRNADEDFNTQTDRSKFARIDDSDAHKYLAYLDERFQCLHHAFVWDVKTVVHASADGQAQIIQSTIIDYCDDLKVAYGSVLQDIYHFALSWAYDENPVIPQVATDLATEVKAINSADSLRSTLGLWRAMFLQGSSRLPLPSLTRIIPAVHSYWNSVKGGSDTSTKLMDDCPIYVPQCAANMESKAVSRIMGLSFVSIHRLRQVFSSKELQNHYGSLHHYRTAAKQRFSFHYTMLECMDYFIGKVDGDTCKEGVTDNNRQLKAIRPTREKIAGSIPIPLPCPFNVTGTFI